MKGVLNRLVHEDKQTLGRFHLFNELNEVFSCAVLELPDRDNQTSISRICAGLYTAKRRWSKKYGWHYILENVQDRSYILIHFGNYYTDTQGCLLFGNAFTDINGDGYRDVTSSKKTMKRLLEVAPEEFTILINDL